MLSTSRNALPDLPCPAKSSVVIMEGDPHPGATKGRMSFQNFNPAIDKLNDAANPCQPAVSATCSNNQSEKIVGGWFDPLNSLELFYSISSLYDLCRIILKLSVTCFSCNLQKMCVIKLLPECRLSVSLWKCTDTTSNYFPFTLLRENRSSLDGEESMNVDKPNCNSNGDLKRKQPEEVSESQRPSKSPKDDQGARKSSPNNSRGSHKQSKHEKLDWNVLRPPKSQNKRA
ncbi:hypothetical protein CK203_007430 [Vitis vinifera]|uniref:Uncharacterized protein n=1 Tax=Vitis vinifera TaxID=29760 RepID=A0A438G1J2_VITVI|nr:hypothetical protein CK203_007430 [Vitis vinifera]